MSDRVTDHRYESGPANTNGPCVADVNPEYHPYAACESPEKDHAYSEYELAPGDMHEPPAYPASSLDWTPDGLAIEDNDR